MSDVFEDVALPFVLSREGGYSNDIRDPGGETNFGISKRAFPHEDIRAMTRQRAAILYRRHYWDKARCPEFPGPIALVLFDGVVNQGLEPTVKQLQRALLVAQDGAIGDQTITAARQAAGSGRLQHVVRDALRRRILRYSTLPGWETYRSGWVDRVLLLHEACLSMEAS